MALEPRHPFRAHMLKAATALVVAFGLALPPALATISNPRDAGSSSISGALTGQFTPASGDPRLIARYGKVSEQSRAAFSFTPVLGGNAQPNRAITVVVRARANSAPASSASRTAALVEGRAPSVAVAPVVYNLGASVGFDRFVMPKMASGLDLRDVVETPRAAPRPAAKTPLFESKLRLEKLDPEGASPRAAPLGGREAVGVEGRLRVTRNLNVTAGVRYNGDDRLQPLTDERRDSQAVFVGTQFRF